MFKGFCFFMKFGWHSDKRYVIYHILHQCIRSMIPIVSVIMPKYIIDVLSDPQHMEYFEIYHLRIYSVWIYIMLFTLYLLLSAMLRRGFPCRVLRCGQGSLPIGDYGCTRS